jgi:Calcineurin-like phosphoesterase.
VNASEVPDVPHAHFAADDWASITIVGDVHGCDARLQTLLDALAVDNDDLVVFVGDLVRKGPDSKAVVDRVADSPNLVSVRGNNEQMLIDSPGGGAGLERADIDALAAWPVVITVGESVVAHAGVAPGTPLRSQEPQTLQTIRRVSGSFWWEQYTGPQRVYFGHTPVEAPIVTDHAVGLDTGCVYGGALTALRLGEETLIQVDAEDTVRRKQLPQQHRMRPQRL